VAAAGSEAHLRDAGRGGAFRRRGPGQAWLDLLCSPEEEIPERKFRWLRNFLVVHVAAERWMHLASQGAVVESLASQPLSSALTLLLLPLAAAVWIPRLAEPAARLAVAMAAGVSLLSFPTVPNHHLVELVCLGVLAIVRLADAGERRLAFAACRWMVLLVLVYSGLQKLVTGLWIRGDVLGYMIATQDRFATGLGPLVPAAELERLRAMADSSIGAGPYAVDSPLVVALSNAVWLGEMALPLFLVYPRTRPVAAAAAVALVGAIEFGAREIFFGCLFVNLLLSFFERDLLRWSVPASVVLYAGLLTARLGFRVDWWFN